MAKMVASQNNDNQYEGALLLNVTAKKRRHSRRKKRKSYCLGHYVNTDTLSLASYGNNLLLVSKKHVRQRLLSCTTHVLFNVVFMWRGRILYLILTRGHRSISCYTKIMEEMT